MASPLDFYLNPANFGSVPQSFQGIQALNALQSAQGPLANLNRTGTTNDGVFARAGQVGPNLTQGGVQDILSQAVSQPLVDPTSGTAQNWLLQNLINSSNPNTISQFTGQQNPFASSQSQSALQQALQNRATLLSRARQVAASTPNLQSTDLQSILGNIPVDQNFGGRLAANLASASMLGKTTSDNLGSIAMKTLPMVTAFASGGLLAPLLTAYRMQQQGQAQTNRMNQIQNALGRIAGAGQSPNLVALQNRSRTGSAQGYQNAPYRTAV